MYLYVFWGRYTYVFWWDYNRRFHRILIYDLDCWPEMEATMEVPPEMNRIGMPSHDAGIPAHDAHFHVTGVRTS